MADFDLLSIEIIAEREGANLLTKAPRIFERNAAARGPVTSVAVAKAANVSQSTVSLVLSGKAEGRVSPTTKARVEEAAARLGYSPNASAQILRTGAPKVLALAVPNVQQPYFGQILVAAELAAREEEYAVILIDTTTDPAWAQRLAGMLRSRLIAGAIVYAGDNAAAQVLASTPDKILWIEAEDSRLNGVDLDLEGGMRQVARHLHGLGHRSLGYFAAEYPKATYQRRFAYLLKESRKLGLKHEAEWRTSATFELDYATQRALAFLDRAPFTAIFCDDDLLAAGVYRAAVALNIPIPQGLSVVGFNDLELARMLQPELTSVAIPANVIGRNAIERLLPQLAKRRASGAPFVADLALSVRGSTTRPRAAAV